MKTLKTQRKAFKKRSKTLTVPIIYIWEELVLIHQHNRRKHPGERKESSIKERSTFLF